MPWTVTHTLLVNMVGFAIKFGAEVPPIKKIAAVSNKLASIASETVPSMSTPIYDHIVYLHTVCNKTVRFYNVYGCTIHDHPICLEQGESRPPPTKEEIKGYRCK